MDIKSGLVGLVVGGFCMFLILGKVPDVRVIREYVAVKGSGTTTATVSTNATITGANHVITKPDGSTTASGANLTVVASSKTETTIVTQYYAAYKIIDNTRNYVVSVRALWDMISLTPQPAIIGLTYSPGLPLDLGICLEYDMARVKPYLGVEVRF